MDDSGLSKRIKELRTQKGITQEELAEISGLSLRTIQRIENNETVPRGDSLKRLAIALNTTPDDIVDWKIQEDKGYLTVMCLSALAFFFFPILGIVVPLIFWILKRDKVKNVDKVGKSLLNFEITWTILFFSYIIFLFTGVIGKIVRFIDPSNTSASIAEIYAVVLILYAYNFIIIVWNTIRVSRSKPTKYVPAFRIFR
ncbi:DUF4870 domain-containing protein [Galbibacter sp.]|uniref:DUF4870 domain-containing protein n=1 Tax=Galbibacter sp. TaxID=2918471 RepID=UPI003A8DA431